MSGLANGTSALLPNISADQILQRKDNGGASLSFNLQGLPSCVSNVSFLLSDSRQGAIRKQVTSADPKKTPFTSFIVPSANAKFSVSVLLLDANGNALAVHSTPSFMVGDVYIVVGQSNSSNHSDVETQATTSYAKVLDVAKLQWVAMQDPLPYASSWNVLPWNPPGAAHVPSGSPWPKFASVLNQELGVPIGVVSIGWGGTAIFDWKKGPWSNDGGPGVHGCHDQAQNTLIGDIGCYPRLTTTVGVLGGCNFKAVLWHQGESDVGNSNLCKGLSGSSNCYAQRLTKIISDFRSDTGCTQPWLSARVSHTAQTGSDGALLNSTTAWNNEVALRSDQTSLWNSGVTLRGPDTDLMIGHYRIDDVHFSGSEKACTSPTPYFHYTFQEGFKNGLAIHGQLWAYYVLKGLYPSLTPSSVGDESALVLEVADVRSDFINLLGRTAQETDQDIEGIRYWAGIEQTGVSKSSVVQSIAGSDEAFVNMQYKLYLSRNATLAEKQPCLTALSSERLSRTQVTSQLQACTGQSRCSSACQ